MKLIKSINSITNNNANKIKSILLLGILMAFLKMLPYGALIGSVLELFNPLLKPGTSLNIAKLWIYFGILIVLYVLQFFIGRIQYFHSFKNCTETINEGRSKFAMHLKKLPMGFFTNYDAGQFSTYMLQDYENVQSLMSDGLEPIFAAVVTPLAGFVCMLFINWQLSLWMMLSVAVAIPAAFLAQKISGKLAGKLLASRTNASLRMVEYLQSIKLVKAYNLQGEKFKGLEKSFDQLRKDSLKQEVHTGLGVVLGKLIVFAGIPILIVAGFSLMTKGVVSIPVYVMFLMIAPKIYNPLSDAIALSAVVSFFVRSVYRIDNIYNEEPMPDPIKSRNVKTHSIDLDNVIFKYENMNVLNGVTAHISEGGVTALVGTSGSGKTTVTRLIARFWDVNKGSVSIGGVDVRELQYEDLISRISIVFQDVFLFHDSIMNNILFGKNGADKDDVVAAAKLANCHEFIMALPNGYDTIVGEGGSTLSGGEKQRISIARAILKNAPIILLDEATASLDPENEASIQYALSNLVKGKTLIVIAHKLKTIADADQILVLEDGRIAQAGKHEELLEKEGLYAKLWYEQQNAKGWKIKNV